MSENLAPDNAPNRVTIIGYGDMGRRVAHLWQDRSVPVRALARSEASAQAQREDGVEPLAGDLDEPSSLNTLALGGDWLYYFAPPSASSEGDARMAAFVAALEGMELLPVRILYISTSGVYGDRGGDWVKESDPINPQTARARRRADAEQRLARWGEAHGVPVVRLRVGGIYAEGRLPLERLQRREPLLLETECGYTNRIHADDLARVCLFALERGEAGVVNAADGQPGNMSQYFKAVARATGLPLPEEIPMAEARERLSPAMLSYLTESRRLDCSKLLKEWGFELSYPSLDAGLTKIFGHYLDRS